MKTNFSSPLASMIVRYVALKQSLGLEYKEQTRILSALDRFMANRQSRDLSGQTFLEWCKTFGHLSNGARRLWMQTARDFCLYRRRSNPRCFVPDDYVLPAYQRPLRPYIFSISEIRQLLRRSSDLPKHLFSPLSPELFRLVIVLLFTTGIRHRELRRLRVADYNPDDATLFIRDSKFHKSRLLPIASDVKREIERFLSSSRSQVPITQDTPLVWRKFRGIGAYSHHGVSSNVRLLLKMAGIQKPDGRLPRVHDFRHSFAVNALLRWYQSGLDVQSKLPFLSAYMGHVNINSTYYYLHFVEPLASLVNSRFANRYGSLISATVARKKEL